MRFIYFIVSFSHTNFPAKHVIIYYFTILWHITYSINSSLIRITKYINVYCSRVALILNPDQLGWTSSPFLLARDACETYSYRPYNVINSDENRPAERRRLTTETRRARGELCVSLRCCDPDEHHEDRRTSFSVCLLVFRRVFSVLVPVR